MKLEKKKKPESHFRFLSFFYQIYLLFLPNFLIFNHNLHFSNHIPLNPKHLKFKSTMFFIFQIIMQMNIQANFLSTTWKSLKRTRNKVAQSFCLILIIQLNLIWMETKHIQQLIHSYIRLTNQSSILISLDRSKFFIRLILNLSKYFLNNIFQAHNSINPSILI